MINGQTKLSKAGLGTKKKHVVSNASSNVGRTGKIMAQKKSGKK